MVISFSNIYVIYVIQVCLFKNGICVIAPFSGTLVCSNLLNLLEPLKQLEPHSSLPLLDKNKASSEPYFELCVVYFQL